MNNIQLTDLDELILTVRDKTSRSYITEAINAYRGGAYRAAIIQTWIATVFDIIAKIREIATQGDRMARDQIAKLDNAIAANDIKMLQKIEEELLNKALNDFEFLSRHEHSDLEQLKKDRNLCAHPAFVTDELLFEPRPERVRMHIVHAVTYLLQRQPTQGKIAIARVIEDIKSPSFPSDLDIACVFLGAKYLNRAKNALIHNLVTILLKALLRDDDPDLPSDYVHQMVFTLQAIARIRPDIYEEKMSTQLAGIVESLNGNRPAATYRLLGSDPRCWKWIGESSRIRLKSAVNHYVTQQETHYAPFRAMAVAELRPTIMAALDSLPEEKQANLIKSFPHPAFADKAIALYSGASGWRQAESLGESVILPMVHCFSDSDIGKILNVVTENRQIWDASGTPRILESFCDGTLNCIQFTTEAWQNFFKFWLENYHNEWVDSKWGNLRQKLEKAGISIPEVQHKTD